MLRAAATLSSIEHGGHRVCQLGRIPRWGDIIRLHRHVGPACVPVRCSPAAQTWPNTPQSEIGDEDDAAEAQRPHQIKAVGVEPTAFLFFSRLAP
jgi:hypothetical protein